MFTIVLTIFVHYLIVNFQLLYLFSDNFIDLKTAKSVNILEKN